MEDIIVREAGPLVIVHKKSTLDALHVDTRLIFVKGIVMPVAMKSVITPQKN